MCDVDLTRFKYFYPNIYDGTPYNHHSLTDLKESYLSVNGNLVKENIDKKKSYKYFCNTYNSRFCVDLTRLSYYLYDYYCDLNKVLNRYKQGLRDGMIHQLAARNKCFFFSDRLLKLTTLYDEIFLDCFNIFVEEKLNAFDETYGRTFKCYFDTSMASLLHIAIFNYIRRSNVPLQNPKFEIKRKEKVYLSTPYTDEQIRDLGLLYEIPEYFVKEMEELHVLDSSKLLLSTN